MKAALPVGYIIRHARFEVVGAGDTLREGYGLYGSPLAGTEALVVDVESCLPVIWVVGKAGMACSNARLALKHVEYFILVSIATNEGVVGA